MNFAALTTLYQSRQSTKNPTGSRLSVHSDMQNPRDTAIANDDVKTLSQPYRTMSSPRGSRWAPCAAAC